MVQLLLSRPKKCPKSWPCQRIHRISVRRLQRCPSRDPAMQRTAMSAPLHPQIHSQLPVSSLVLDKSSLCIFYDSERAWPGDADTCPDEDTVRLVDIPTLPKWE